MSRRKRDESRSSKAQNIRRTMTNTSLGANESDKATVAVTTQESMDGIREKAMRIASLDEMGASSSASRESSPGGAEIDKTKTAKEFVRGFVGSMTKEGDIVVACDSNSKLWKDVDLRRAMQNWNMKFVDTVRSPESALRGFTSCERLANQMKIKEVREVGKLVKRTEMGDPKAEIMLKKIETGDMKVGALVKKIQVNEIDSWQSREISKLWSRGMHEA